jgi:hypothetical protein
VSMPEEWRPVVGWEGFYEVSDRGRVRSVARTVMRSNGYAYRISGPGSWLYTWSMGIRRLPFVGQGKTQISAFTGCFLRPL